MIIILGLLVFLIAFLLFFVTLSFLVLLFSLLLELPYVGTDRQKIATILIFAQIKKGQTIVDLGSGDGRLLIASAKVGAFAIGYEINPLLVALTRIKARLLNLHPRGELKVSSRSHPGGVLKGSIVIKKQSLWNADLKVADVIFVYALRKSMKKFEDFIYKNAQKGTRVVVNTNPFPNKQPLKSNNGIFLYKV